MNWIKTVDKLPDGELIAFIWINSDVIEYDAESYGNIGMGVLALDGKWYRLTHDTWEPLPGNIHVTHWTQWGSDTGKSLDLPSRAEVLEVLRQTEDGMQMRMEVER